MNTRTSPEKWATDWLDSVASGGSTMSQRMVASIESRGGGLAAVKKLAEARGLHLLRLTDEHGNELLAASKRPFEVIC